MLIFYVLLFFTGFFLMVNVLTYLDKKIVDVENKTEDVPFFRKLFKKYFDIKITNSQSEIIGVFIIIYQFVFYLIRLH